MSTPAMAFGAGLRNILVSLWLVWSLTFAISRIFLLHDAYISESNKRIDERWLREKCKEPEFYSNLRQHTDLCTEVEKNARSSLLLVALNKVASNTHACGTVSCLDLVFSMFSRLGWHVALLLLALVLVAPNFIYAMLLQCHQQRQKKFRRAFAYQTLGADNEDCEGDTLVALHHHHHPQQTQWLSSSGVRKRAAAAAAAPLAEKNTIKLV